MKITKSELQKIIKEAVQEEREPWLANDLNDRHELVANVSKEINYDVGMAMAFAVAILEDVNAHKMAAEVNKLLLKM